MFQPLRFASAWVFLTLLLVGYSPTLLYPAVHHDRYAFFFEETKDCTKQWVQLETFRMGRPLGAVIDCALTDMVETLGAYQAVKGLCIALMIISFLLLVSVLPARLRPWERHLLGFLVLALPGFQYTVFMPLVHFWVSLIVSLCATRVFLGDAGLRVKSRAGYTAIGLLFFAMLNYPAFTAVFLFVLGVHWLMSDASHRAFAFQRLKTGVGIYFVSVLAYVVLLRVVYKIFDIQSSIYSTRFANPFSRVGMVFDSLSFSLNHFWWTPDRGRPWLVMTFLAALVLAGATVLYRAWCERGRPALREALYAAGGVIFLFLAIESPILATKSGLILHRTTVLGAAFLVALVWLALSRALSNPRGRMLLVAGGVSLSAAVAYSAFENLRQSSLNSLMEIEALREGVKPGLERGVRWIHFENNFGPNKSYIGVPPSRGDEFRFSSGRNLGNLRSMVRLAIGDSSTPIQLCYLEDAAEHVACIREALGRGEWVFTQQPSNASTLSTVVGAPFWLMDLTSRLRN